jgi:hypothetical protein
MRKHSKNVLESITCPFAIAVDKVDWKDIKRVISTDDHQSSVIVETGSNEIFLVSIPVILYEAIFRSGEENVIEQDLGFNELS